MWLRGGDGVIVGDGRTQWTKPQNPELYATLVLAMLRPYKFDGVVFDGWYDTIYQERQWFPPEYPNFFAEHGKSLAYPDNEVWWSDWLPFIANICGQIQDDGYKVIGNCAGEYDPIPHAPTRQGIQRACVDGNIYESFGLSFGGDYLPPEIISKRLKSLEADPLRYVWTADLGLKSGIYQAGNKLELCYALYLLSLPNAITRYNSRAFGFHSDGTPAADKRTDPGSPIEKIVEYRYPNGDWLWHRRFSNITIEVMYNSYFDAWNVWM